MPASALFYADVNLDQGSNAWKQFSAVGQRFPGWTKFSTQVTKSLNSTDSSSKLTFSKDIQPWLGDAAAIGVTSVDATAGKPHFLAYIASTNDGKAKDALSKDSTSDGSYKGYDLFTSHDGGSATEAAVGNGAVLMADSTATLHDAIDTRDGTDSLASDDAFTSAMSKLPKDTLVRGYVNTRKVAALVSVAVVRGMGGPNTAQIENIAKSLNSIDSLSFAGWASDNGFHLSVRTTVEPGTDTSPFTSPADVSDLTKQVPGDAFAFLAFADYGRYLTQGLAGAGPAAGQQLKLFTRQTGLSVKRDLLPLLSGEQLFYAAPGMPVRASLVLRPSHPAAAAVAMHHVTALIAQQQQGAKVSPLASGTGQTITVGPGLAISWRLTPEGLLTIGNDPAAGTAPSSPLSSSSDYTQLLSEAGVPSGASVPLYVNVADALKLVPVAADPNLKHVGAVLAWSSHSGQDYSSDLFLQVD